MHRTTLEFAGDSPDTAGAVTFGYLPSGGGEMRFSMGEKTIVAALHDDGTLAGTVDGEPFAAACHLSERCADGLRGWHHPPLQAQESGRRGDAGAAFERQHPGTDAGTGPHGARQRAR